MGLTVPKAMNLLVMVVWSMASGKATAILRQQDLHVTEAQIIISPWNLANAIACDY